MTRAAPAAYWNDGMTYSRSNSPQSLRVTRTSMAAGGSISLSVKPTSATQFSCQKRRSITWFRSTSTALIDGKNRNSKAQHLNQNCCGGSIAVVRSRPGNSISTTCLLLGDRPRAAGCFGALRCCYANPSGSSERISRQLTTRYRRRYLQIRHGPVDWLVDEYLATAQ